MTDGGRLVVVGASWGGLDTVGRLLERLPARLGAAVAIAQHRRGEPSELAALLERRAPFPVVEVCDKQPIEADRAFLAPPDYHLLVEPGRFALSLDARVHHARPSIDVLFESAADAYGARVIGIVLTGANEDGAAGLARIKERGGLTFVQDPATAVRPAMPEAAIAGGGALSVLDLDALAQAVARECHVAPADARSAA